MRITIVGTGYVGLVSGACLARVGHQVHCVDVDARRIATIRQGTAPFHEPGLPELLSEVIRSGRLVATTELASAVRASEVTLMAVGTPLKGEAIDLSQVTTAVEQVGRALRGMSSDHCLAVKSTVVPGTTDTVVKEILEAASGRPVGEVGLCVNPEFLREGRAIQDFMDPDRIVIGQWDERSGAAMAEVYRPFRCPTVFTTLRNAELIKYASNALLGTLISFSNELARFCEVTPGTDVEDVLSGVALDRRLSVRINGRPVAPQILDYLRAGCGFGGSCLPKDLQALVTSARERGMTPRLLDAVLAVNTERPQQVVALTERLLGSLEGAAVTVVGLAFKPGTDDVRDSPALKIIRHLLDKGAQVRAYDPVVLKVARAALDSRVRLCETPTEALQDADAAMIVTAWPELETWDWAHLVGMMRQRIIIDGRNTLRRVPWPHDVTYVNIGRTPGGVSGAATEGSPERERPTGVLSESEGRRASGSRSHAPVGEVPSLEGGLR